MKQCEHCGDLFNPTRSTHRLCSARCQKAKYRRAHRKQISAYRAEYYRANREQIVARKAEYYAEQIALNLHYFRDKSREYTRKRLKAQQEAAA